MRLDTINSDIWADVNQCIPAGLRSAWHKALGWRPRLSAQGQPPSKAAQAVAQGKRPLLYGWRNDVVEHAARQQGLPVTLVGQVAVAALAENEDLVGLMSWTHTEKLPSHIAHAIRGVLLGYPLSDVEDWVRTHVAHSI